MAARGRAAALRAYFLGSIAIFSFLPSWVILPRSGSVRPGRRASGPPPIRRRGELRKRAELALELGERATLWRLRHFKMVERLIGADVIGTQGTPVELLRPLLDRRVFPELWAARTELTKLAWPDENA